MRTNHPGVAVALFMVTAFALHMILSLPRVQTSFLDPYTVWIAAVTRFVLGLFVDITGSGNVLGDRAFMIEVRNVCNGTDLWILFTAAVVAFPASWMSRAVGLAVGIPLLSLINLLRVTGLWITGRYFSRDLFDTFHLYIWQVILILFTAGIFSLYLRWAYARERR